MSIFLSHRNRYTLERLKRLHSDLLLSTDVSTEHLGRRGCLDDEWDNGTKDPKNSCNDKPFSLQDLKRSLTILPMMHMHRRRPSSFRSSDSRKGQELAAAFRFLAATRSPDKEGDSGGAAVERDDDIVSALHAAKRIERNVVNIIREIGEVVANAGQTTQHVPTKPWSLNCDPCFEYFSEKNVLSLLVEIAKQNPGSQSKTASAQHGVVWSPMVKAQVMQTVSLLVAKSGGRNSHALFYILSQNAINDLIECMLPLQQWTDPALEKLVPPFVDLLKNLGLQLAGTPDLFPFFTLHDTFPLFHAALEVGTSAYAQTDSFVRITSLSIIVNTMKINNPTILAWVSAAITDLRKLSNHFCQLMLNQYYRIADLTTGPIVDGMRCSAVQAQIVALHDQIHLLNDVFSCGIPGLNVRLCELLMRGVVSVALKNLEPPRERAFISVGISDLDVIPQRECLAQVSCMFFAQLFRHVDYVPFLRMLAVALFHPKSTPLLVNCDKKSKLAFSPLKEEDYVFVPALDAIAKGKGVKSDKFVDNPFRQALTRTLRGDFGEWRFPVAAIVVESVLGSEAFDIETLQILEIIRRDSWDEKDEVDADKEHKTESPSDTILMSDYKPTEVERALEAFLIAMPKSPLSSVSKTCLECAGSVVLALLHQSSISATKNGTRKGSFRVVSTPLCEALFHAKASFCRRTLESQRSLGVADIFLELAEFAVSSRYKKVVPTSGDGLTFGSQPPATYACHLSQLGCAALCESSELLVRKFRVLNYTDVEETRFYIEAAIHLRALCKTVAVFSEKLSNITPQSAPKNCFVRSTKPEIIALDLVEVADEFALTFGGIGDRPDARMHLDLRGRMTFSCSLSTATVSGASATRTGPVATHVLVVDPTDFYVVRERGASRGSIVCRVGLQKVIAAASDAHWLHLAVRHPDVGHLIKNGNMILQFENAGTCLIVREYLDRSRSTVRRELMDRFRTLMEPEAITVGEAKRQPERLDVDEHVATA